MPSFAPLRFCVFALNLLRQVILDNVCAKYSTQRRKIAKAQKNQLLNLNGYISGHTQACAIVEGEKIPLLTGTHLKVGPKQKHSLENHSATKALVLLVKCSPAWALNDHIVCKVE